MLILKGGQVLTPAGVVNADVAIDGATVVAVEPEIDATGEVFDAGGCTIGPGLVDLHVHMREPGQEWKETILSASEAAVAGGFTAIVAMPNTSPAIDSGHLARFVSDRGRAAGLCLVIPAGAISLGRNGQHLAHLDEMWEAGVRIFTDDGDSVADAGLLRHAMEYLATLGGVVAQHAEDGGLADGGHMHEGTVSARLGMRGLPSAAEEVVIARDLTLVRMTGSRYHAQHISTAGSVELIRAAKSEGLAVTAEVAPHTITFADEMVLTMDPDFKMYPPLRTPRDIEALKTALVEGVIDVVATDHAPHAAAECEVPFEEAPRGVIGLETAVSAIQAAFGFTPEFLFDRMSVAPARIAGLTRHGRKVEVGAPANLCVIDPALEWTANAFRSKSANSPWKGRTMRGRAVATIFEGCLVHQVTRV